MPCRPWAPNDMVYGVSQPGEVHKEITSEHWTAGSSVAAATSPPVILELRCEVDAPPPDAGFFSMRDFRFRKSQLSQPLCVGFRFRKSQLSFCPLLRFCTRLSTVPAKKSQLSRLLHSGCRIRKSQNSQLPEWLKRFWELAGLRGSAPTWLSRVFQGFSCTSALHRPGFHGPDGVFSPTSWTPRTSRIWTKKTRQTSGERGAAPFCPR